MICGSLTTTDLSHEFEFETQLVKISWVAYETPKMIKIVSILPLRSPYARVIQKKPGSIPLVTFL